MEPRRHYETLGSVETAQGVWVVPPGYQRIKKDLAIAVLRQDSAETGQGA